MNLLVFFIVGQLFAATVAREFEWCRFDRDCPEIADGPYSVCRFGQCTFMGSKLKECAQSADCKRMRKCKGRTCTCFEGSCEWQCDATKDCFSRNNRYSPFFC